MGNLGSKEVNMKRRLSKPVTVKYNEHGISDGLRYGVASMQGWRIRQEDAHCATTQVSEKLKDWSFFAVFDGHFGDGCEDGSKISIHCAEHLLENIVNIEEDGSSNFADRIRSGYLNLDRSMLTVPVIGGSDAGTTAVCAFVTPEHIYIANCGDSRAVLCNSGVPIFNTEDHVPSLKNEHERIKRAFGRVHNGRVEGHLAMSRCLGNYVYKADEDLGQCEQMVSPEPEVFVRARNEKDEFLVIASDGIWDVMPNEDICKLIRSRLLVTDDLATICNEVLDTCFCKGSKDNMTIILVTFPAAPTPSSEAITKEKNLEMDIEKLIIKIISIPETIKEDKKWELVSVENLLSMLHIMERYLTDLPPEGNIGTKRIFIERIFQQCRDRGNLLKIIVDEAVDVLLHKDSGNNRNFVEELLDKLKENNLLNLPSGDNMDTA